MTPHGGAVVDPESKSCWVGRGGRAAAFTDGEAYTHFLVLLR